MVYMTLFERRLEDLRHMVNLLVSIEKKISSIKIDLRLGFVHEAT